LKIKENEEGGGGKEDNRIKGLENKEKPFFGKKGNGKTVQTNQIPKKRTNNMWKAS